MAIRTLLVDDHAMLRRGLRLLLAEEDDIEVVGEAGNGREAVELARKLAPDVIVMDINMPDLNGIEACRQVMASCPKTRVMALSIHSGERFVGDMLRAGASGYVLKESAPEDLVAGIRTVVRKEVYLSPAVAGVVVSQLRGEDAEPGVDEASLTLRERELLQMMADGHPAKEIAARLRVAIGTVETRQRRLMKRLHVSSVAELANMARERRWVGDDAVKPRRKAAFHPLRTKLHSPPLPPDLVPRTEALREFTEYAQRTFTLVSAPAGYGKSVLAGSWLEDCPQPHAWLSLDNDDNTLRGFLAYFVAAVQDLLPDFGGTIQALLRAPNLPPLSILVDSLINDLVEVKEPFVVVLDDYHCIHDNAIHDLMVRLLDQAPACLHLVLLTRSDPPFPLNTWRAQARMNEITAGQLRFSLGETDAFLRKASNAPLDTATVGLIDTRIEGWPAGLRLMAHALRNCEDPDRVVAGLKGGVSAIIDYLAAEVLSRQSPVVADLMLKTSILDRFCAPLCDRFCSGAVGTDAGTIEGQAFLEGLQANNLFLIALDPENRWFRYHHLFQQLLQNQLENQVAPKGIRALHAQASAWFAESGLIEEAIRHALEAGENTSAVQLVGRHRQAVLEDDRWYILEKWLSLFPETVVREHAELLMGRAWVLYHCFDIAAIPAVMDVVESLLGDTAADRVLRGETAFFRGYLCYFQNEGSRSLEHLERARQLLPEGPSEVRGQTEILHGLASQMQGCEQEAIDHVGALLRNLRSSRSVMVTRIQITLVYIQIIAGELDKARAANQRLYDFSVKQGFGYAEAWSLYLKGLIHFLQGDLEEAIDQFHRAVERKYLLHTRATVDGMVGLVLSYQALGQPDQALSALGQLTDFTASLDDPGYAVVAQSCRARLSIMQGAPEPAVKWVKGGEAPPAENMVWWLEIPAVSFCRALIAEGTDKALAQAAEKLQAYLRLNQANHNTCQAIQVMLLLAMVHEKQGDGASALAMLREAVTLAEPGGFVHPFVELGAPMRELLSRLSDTDDAPDFAGSLLTAFEQTPTDAEAESPVPEETAQSSDTLLTQRESEILVMVADGWSNKQIAAELYISTETVKKHLYNTYQKLGVDSRINALAKARKLGVLPPG